MAYYLVVPFDRDCAEFARGVEVGMLYARLHAEALPVEATVHESNAEMALRLAEATNTTIDATDLGGEWLSITFR